MGRREIMATAWGEMLDMIACLNVYNGAELKDERVYTDFDAQMEVD